jgi:hypothetical protein
VQSVRADGEVRAFALADLVFEARAFVPELSEACDAESNVHTLVDGAPRSAGNPVVVGITCSTPNTGT